MAGRFGTDKAGYAEMVAAGRQFPERVFATGNGRKTDPADAHSVAMAALRAGNMNRVQVDDDLVVLGLLTDRRDELGWARTQTSNRLYRLLLELATIKPRDPTRHDPPPS